MLMASFLSFYGKEVLTLFFWKLAILNLQIQYGR